jgi:hypothetical protein
MAAANPTAVVAAAVYLAEEVQRLRTGERRPQPRLTRHIGDASVGLDRLPLAVEAEDLASPRRRADQSQQEPDRGLPRAVRAEVAQHLPLTDFQLKVD